MPFVGMRRVTPQPENSHLQHINDLGRAGSLPARIAACTASILLILASAGFGCTFAYTQGAHHGPALAALAVCMALGLEIGKPFAIEGVFAAFRSLAVGRGMAMLALGTVAVGYSLTAELSLMAMARGDMGASRAKVADATKDARAELARVTRERSAMSFAPATGEAVTAARDAVAAAVRARKAECAGGRGPKCRAREADEAAARGQLAKVVADRAATERAQALDARADALRARLAQAPATAAADPGAAALASYLSLLGVTVPAAALSQWLVLVGVLALETGSALAVVLVHAASGGARASRSEARHASGARERRTAAVQELQAPVVPEPEKAATGAAAAGEAGVEPPAPAVQPVSKKSKRGRPARERQEAQAKIVELARANGGQLSKNSVRRLGKLAGASRGTAHNALAGLLAAGVVAKVGTALVLTA